ALTNLNVINAGTVTASTSTTGTEHSDVANSGIDFTRDVTRYWTLTAGGGMAVASGNATFTFVSTDVDFGAVTANFLVRRYSGGSWSTTTVGTLTSISAQVTGLSSLGDFVIGEQLIHHYLVSAASPQSAGSNFVTTVTA